MQTIPTNAAHSSDNNTASEIIIGSRFRRPHNRLTNYANKSGFIEYVHSEYLQCVQKNVPFLIFGITRSKISWFQQFLVYAILRKLVSSRLSTSRECHCTTLWNPRLLLLPACYRNIIIKCFNEEIKASNKKCKVNESASVFFTTFSIYSIFIVEVCTVLIKVYTVFFGKK